MANTTATPRSPSNGSRTPSARTLRTGGTSSPRPAPTSSRVPLGERRYAWVSQRPLHVLVFLLPLVIAYEVGSALYLFGESSTGETIRAHEQLSRLLGAFGTSGLGVFLPGALLVAVLLAWHILSKDPWRLRASVLGGMLVESILWTVPLLVLGAMAQRVANETLSAAAVNGANAIASSPTPTKLTLAIGAGLYEELLFRLFGIAAIHFVLADIFRMKTRPAIVVAVLISAIAFALYHDATVFASGAGGVGGLDIERFAFLTIAGVYLGGIFVLRGFGIVVAAHALYDVVVFVAS